MNRDFPLFHQAQSITQCLLVRWTSVQVAYLLTYLSSPPSGCTLHSFPVLSLLGGHSNNSQHFFNRQNPHSLDSLLGGHTCNSQPLKKEFLVGKTPFPGWQLSWNPPPFIFLQSGSQVGSIFISTRSPQHSPSIYNSHHHSVAIILIQGQPS